MLSVWLPLNGDLHNQGLSNITVINNGATVDNNGKIGKCYSFDGNDDFINLGNIGSYFDGSAFSICFWIYSLENKTRAAVFSSYGLSSTSNFWGLELNSSNNNYCNNNLRFDWLGSDTYSPDDFVTYNAWTHICVTYDGVNQIKMYKNGALIQTSTRVLNAIPVGNTYYLGRDSRTGSTAFNGKLNDFRIYDHCLSPRECKQISTALVLHYPLAMPGGENLYKHSKDFFGTWVSGANWTTDSEQYNGFVVKKKSSIWGGLAQNVPCSNGDIFTISFYAKVDSGGNIQSIHRSSLGNVTTGLNILGGNFTSTNYWVANNDDGTTWKRYWATVQITSSDITYLQWRIENSVADKFLYVCGMKLERGSRSTPWIPNPADAEYSTFGFDDGIEYDVSGYGHNGTKTGVTYSSDSPRYNTSTKFDANTNDVTPMPCFSNGQTVDEMSISIWFNIMWNVLIDENGTDLSDESGNILVDGISIDNIENSTGPNFFSLGENEFVHARIAASTSIWSYSKIGTGSPTQVYFDCENILDNEWHHFVYVFNKGIITCYIDGEMLGSEDKSSIANYLYCGSQSWHLAGYTATGGKFIGSLSDFRLYATALSTDEIADLYHTPISLSNTGTLLTQGEYVEV